MNTASLYLDTPLSQAVFRFFNHLEADILESTSAPGSVKAYIFGGCALHIHTNARGSNDIDVEFNSAKWLTEKDIVFRKQFVTYQQEGVRRQVSLDQTFTPTLGPLHEDYQEDAIRLQRNQADSPLWIYVVTPEDLAVSKLGRYSHQDREDILTLLRLKRMSPEAFQERATEAIKYYVGNTSAATGHLKQVMSMYHQSVG